MLLGIVQPHPPSSALVQGRGGPHLPLLLCWGSQHPQSLSQKCQADGGTDCCQGLVVGLVRRKTCSSQDLKSPTFHSEPQGRQGVQQGLRTLMAHSQGPDRPESRSDSRAGQPRLVSGKEVPGAVPMAPSHSHPAGSARACGVCPEAALGAHGVIFQLASHLLQPLSVKTFPSPWQQHQP